jgi:hypothetical protein
MNISRQLRRRLAATLGTPGGILAPLNQPKLSARANELQTLVQVLVEIERREAAQAVLRDGSPRNNIRGRDPNDPYVRANRILSSCRWSPGVAPPPNSPFRFRWKARTEKQDWENMFVRWLLTLRESNEVGRVRTCLDCKHWFYAVVRYQRFCTHACRQRFHSRDESFKQHRRDYMRRRRAEEKSVAIRAKELARAERTMSSVKHR